jgi:hypothetical protein
MTARRTSPPDVLPDAAAHAAAARRDVVPPGQLVDELYRGHALRLTRMALLLVGTGPAPRTSSRKRSSASFAVLAG